MISKNLEFRSGHREVKFRASCGQNCDLTPSLVSLKLLASYPLANSQGRCRFVVLNIHRRLWGEWSQPLSVLQVSVGECVAVISTECHLNYLPVLAEPTLASISRFLKIITESFAEVPEC